MVEISPFDLGQPFNPHTFPVDADAVYGLSHMVSSAVVISLASLWQYWYYQKEIDGD